MPLGPQTSLGESLIAHQVIGPEILVKAKQEGKKSGEPLRRVLVRMGLVTEENILEFYRNVLRIPTIDLTHSTSDPRLANIIPEEFARRELCLPLHQNEGGLMVAMADPLDVLAIDELHLKTGLTIEPVAAREADIRKAIDQYYAPETTISELLQSLDLQSLSLHEEEEEVEKLQSLAEEAPIIKLVNTILVQAVRENASDVHLEPAAKSLLVRMRIDGVLHEMLELPKHLQPAILSRIKIMADLNIATKRVPQDGRFPLNFGREQYDIRVSSLPTLYGENVVLRLLNVNSILLSLRDMGMSKGTLETYEKLIHKSHGIILVTGPTGSGKTTSLYATLHAVSSSEKNIVTIEDPIEYRLNYARQSQADPKVGLTFAAGLRAILRQDPDIIMVGEIRDHETAEIAIQSALTGHLVFSTLHTNNAASAITRLIDMQVEPFLISSSMIGIVAQRLVRKVCTFCKHGCDKCKQTGYRGRMAIFELLTVDDKVRDLTMRRAGAAEIEKAAQANGMKTLLEDGMDKVAQGITSLEEVLRVTQAE